MVVLFVIAVVIFLITVCAVPWHVDISITVVSAGAFVLPVIAVEGFVCPVIFVAFHVPLPVVTVEGCLVTTRALARSVGRRGAAVCVHRRRRYIIEGLGT